MTDWEQHNYVKGSFTHVGKNGRWCHSKPEIIGKADGVIIQHCEVCEEKMDDMYICREEVFPLPDDKSVAHDICYVSHSICGNCYETMMKCEEVYYYYSISSELYYDWIEKIRIPEIKEPDCDDELEPKFGMCSTYHYKFGHNPYCGHPEKYFK